MSYFVNTNVSMKVNRSNRELCEKIKDFISDYAKECEEGSNFRMDCPEKNYLRIHYQAYIEITLSMTLFSEIGSLIDAANDGSYAIETCTGDDGTYYNLYGSVRPVEKKLSEISDLAEWHRENDVFLCASAPSDVGYDCINSLSEELASASLCKDLVQIYKSDNGMTYYLYEMPEWRELNKERIAKLTELINNANKKAARLGARITVVDEASDADPNEYFDNFDKTDFVYITENCSSVLVLTTNENGIADVKVIAFEK